MIEYAFEISFYIMVDELYVWMVVYCPYTKIRIASAKLLNAIFYSLLKYYSKALKLCQLLFMILTQVSYLLYKAF